MGGKRKSGRGFAGQYTVEEAAFWLLDGRLEGLTGTQRYALFILGIMCVVERRETLPPELIRNKLGTYIQISSRYVPIVLERIRNKCLIGIAPNGEVTVFGVKSRHRNLKWKDGDYIDPNAQKTNVNMMAQAVSDKRLGDAVSPDGDGAPANKPKPHKSDLDRYFEDRQAKAGGVAIG